jgi:hypothetical protein
MIKEFAIVAYHVTVYKEYKRVKKRLLELEFLKVYNNDKLMTESQCMNCLSRLCKNNKALFVELANVAITHPRMTVKEIAMMIDDLKTVKKAQKRVVFCIMKYLILAILPGALCKREFDHPLNCLEEIMLMELLPGCIKHPIWESCYNMVRISLTNIIYKRCRVCGKHNIDKTMTCKVCKQCHFCSGKCKRWDIQNVTFGHSETECMVLSKHSF